MAKLDSPISDKVLFVFLAQKRPREQGGDDPEVTHSGSQGLVVLAALCGNDALAKLTEQFEVLVNQISLWRWQVIDNMAASFDKETVGAVSQDKVKDLHAKIVPIDAGSGFFGIRIRQGGIVERKSIIDRIHSLKLSRQCELLDLQR